MTDRRPYISLKTKLAAALCNMLRPDASGKLVPVIDREAAKSMSEAEILAAFEWDHYPIPVHRDGPDAHWNLTPLPVKEHREKTARIDVPGAAKDKRIMARQAEFRRKMLAKAGQAVESIPPSQRQRKGRPMPGSKASGFRKRMDGTVERR